MSDVSEKLKKSIAKQSLIVEDLLSGAGEYFKSIAPVDVETVLGETAVTFRVPFIHPSEFSELADHHPPRPGVAADQPLWFSLDGVARNYPNVTLVQGDDVDDLYRVRDKEAVYIWPEIFDALPPEDQSNVRMAVWAMHIWEPQQRLSAAKTKKEVDNG